MITLQDLYDRVILQLNIETTRYTTVMFLKDIHYIVQDFWSEVVKKNKWNNNWDIWYTNTVSLQDEYKTPQVTSVDVWADYIDSISISFDWNIYSETWNIKYIPCNIATETQINNWEYYLEYQPKTQPIYFQRDNSIFIAPDIRSNEIWINRIKITWNKSINSWSWTLTTTETEIKLPLQVLETIVIWCLWKASIIKRLDKSEINDYKNDYLLEKQNSLYKIIDNSPFVLEFPN